MGVSLTFLDKDNKPVKNKEVMVLWSDWQHSTGRTDESGNVDLHCSGGTANSITIDGQSLGSRVLSDGNTVIKLPAR